DLDVQNWAADQVDDQPETSDQNREPDPSRHDRHGPLDPDAGGDTVDPGHHPFTRKPTPGELGVPRWIGAGGHVRPKPPRRGGQSPDSRLWIGRKRWPPGGRPAKFRKRYRWELDSRRHLLLPAQRLRTARAQPEEKPAERQRRERPEQQDDPQLLLIERA